ncbi:MAG: DUF5655 domain-containing protein [Candidatus Cloacimonetes bacterium]|nr:DUF5655 domain-containing protein [Candidatus Cloacimonadota bacterium]
MSEKNNEKVWAGMLRNLLEKTGKPLEEWVAIINKQPFTRTSDKVTYLRKEFGIGQGYAGLLIYHAKIAKEGSPDTAEQLIEKQYFGKEELKPIYDKLIGILRKFGDDVEIAPKQSYVSLSRNTQFAMLTPASKIRFDIALKLKDQEPRGVLETLPTPGMCTHRIKLGTVEDITKEVIDWLKLAYDKDR